MARKDGVRSVTGMDNATPTLARPLKNFFLLLCYALAVVLAGHKGTETLTSFSLTNLRSDLPSLMAGDF